MVFLPADIGPQTQSRPIYFERLVTLARHLCRYLELHEGIDAVALHDNERDRCQKKFASMPAEEQDSFLNHFVDYCEVLSSLSRQGQSVCSSRAAYQLINQRHGWTSPNDSAVLSMLDHQSHLEVWDRWGRLVFRNPEILAVTSHSLTALALFESRELFHYPETIRRADYQLQLNLLTGHSQEPIFSPYDSYVLHEVGSPHSWSLRVVVLAYVPLFDHFGKLQAIARTVKYCASHAISLHI